MTACRLPGCCWAGVVVVRWLSSLHGVEVRTRPCELFDGFGGVGDNCGYPSVGCHRVAYGLLVSMEIVVEQCLGNDRLVVGDVAGGFLANLLDTAHVIVERFVALWVGEAECFLPWFGGDVGVLLYAGVGDECGYRCRGVLGLVDFLAGVLESLERYFVLVSIEKPVVER